MKRLIYFLLVMLFGLSAKAQTDVLDIAGVEVTPEETATKYYYLKNVGTGLYMSYGGEWGTHCIETNAAHPIVVETNGDKVALGSLVGYLDSNTLWMDWAKSTSTWTLEKVAGYDNQYYIVSGDGRVLTSAGHSSGLLQLTANAEKLTASSKSFQRWVFLTEDDVRNDKLVNASVENPFDVTPLIKAATFDLVDGFDGPEISANNPLGENPALMDAMLAYNSAWTNYADHDKWLWECGFRSKDPAEYNWMGVIDGPAETVEVVQSVTLPAGTYHFSFKGFYNYKKIVSDITQRRASGEDNYTDYSINEESVTKQTMDATVEVAGKIFTLNQGSDELFADFDNLENVAAVLRDGDDYMQCGNFYLPSETTVEIKISKPATGQSTESAGNGWYNVMTGYYQRELTRTTYSNRIFLDDFSLTYYGAEDNTAIDFSHATVYTNYLKANIEEYKSVLNSAGQAVFDNSDLMTKVNNGSINTKAAYYEALAELAEVYDAALIEHAMASVTGEGADMTHLINNNSFETGNGNGWTYAIQDAVGDIGAFQFATEGMDGSWVFNSYCGQTMWWGWGWNHKPVEQTIVVPNGLYELTALVASDDNRKCYVIGEDYYNGVQTVGPNVFVEQSVQFLVEDGTATIKACASNVDIAHGTWYWPDGGTWYKADNFRLKYLTDENHGRLKLALDEANNAIAAFDSYGKSVIDISDIQSAYDLRKYKDTDTRSLVAEIHNRLNAAAKKQKTVNADMTWAIKNASFETGDWTGWTVTTVADTRIARQAEAAYAALGADGRYLFNTWNGDSQCPPITQTIEGIPNGRYRLTAMVTSHGNRKVFIAANGSVSEGAVAAHETRFVPVEVEFEVTNGTATISAVGENAGVYNAAGGYFFKADDFRLTYLGNEITLNQDTETLQFEDGQEFTNVIIDRTIPAKAWSTLIIPFDMDIPSEWSVKELTNDTYVDASGCLCLRFADAASIKAGVPYLVHHPEDEAIALPEAEYVTLRTYVGNVSGNGVVGFTGTFVNSVVPAGSFYLSGNKFYRATDDVPTKAYRAWFTPASANVKSMSFSFEDEATGIEGVGETEAAVEAIFSVDGTLRSDLQKGINIVKMNNGTVKKVLVP